MLEVLRQVILRLVLGNTKRNKKYRMEEGIYQEKLAKGKKGYYVNRVVNGSMYEGLCSWVYGMAKKFSIVLTIAFLIIMAGMYCSGYETKDLLLCIFGITLLWSITIGCDIGYQYCSKTVWLFMEDGVLSSNIWGKVRLIPYEEIKEMVVKKRVTMRKGCLLVPYKGGKIPLQMYTEESAQAAIPILNRECGLHLPSMDLFSTREKVRKGGMGSILFKVGFIVFMCFFVFFEAVAIIDYGKVQIYLDRELLGLYAVVGFIPMGIGLVLRILFFYPIWKEFSPYKEELKVR